MKIVVPYGMFVPEEFISGMREIAQVTPARDSSQQALLDEARDADFIVAGPTTCLDRKLIESAGSLKYIARTGVGVDSIDLQAATERGVFVTNSPALTADSVSEFTVALLLGLAKNIPRCDRAVKEGRWGAAKSELVHVNVELSGKTHGVVGLGKIGSRVAVVCKALGMKVLYFKRNSETNLERLLGVEYSPLETLIRECDSISLHLPLTSETRNMFDRPQLESMKKTVLLINQARGEVVNEEALVQALKEGRIGGYATDVYGQEPPDPQDELFKFKNVVAAPHMGGGTREARVRSYAAVAENIVKVLQGGAPHNLVNKDVLPKKPL